MNDPLVVSLTYELTAVDGATRFREDHRAVNIDLPNFSCTLKGLRLTARPNGHYPCESAARADLEPLLDDWASFEELTKSNLILFRFESAEVIDRSPTPGVVSRVAAGTLSLATGSGRGHVLAPPPKPPPKWFREGPVTRRLRLRLRSMKFGTESLLSVSYALLTKIESEFGPSRKTAGTRLCVSLKVLRKVGELSTVNDPDRWRKAGGAERALTPEENEWLRRSIDSLVLRVARVEANVSDLTLLTMKDLPLIP